MSADPGGRSGDARARAAQTKRDRTRRALLEAADMTFATRGWARTRMEDIAATAEVSPASAYNHFASKHTLIGHVYAPYVTALVDQADQDRERGRDLVDALKDQVSALTRMTSRNQGLTAAFWFALNDYAGGRPAGPAEPGDPDDPRVLAPIPETVLGLVADGQGSGEFRSYPEAGDVAATIANMLLIRAVNRPHDPPERTAELLLTAMFGLLKPALLLDAERPFSGAH
ncbi:TetR/AcrR family transcriptional regulator [Pseudonocardia sp. WMMC193]|uniref:TetR/AcrR family transcriptional regulator n=1 Tax=Pseudonocardia sp. WMMC193 TaxID=2911965 RepID=UPI001F0176B2|nr:TetR/AcrR family transcriptional regulator [Pseudonocardia sp. WMMC193]MCF7549200.1 TetR family transcriptional regulator [Pseudonocardia sp. WMMC193]